MTTEDSSVAPSSSDCSEKLEAIKSASELLAQGKRNLVCGEIPQAVNLYQEAVQLLVKACGELSRDCADAYFCYGCALLDLGRMETNVLGVALEGVEVEEENEEAASEQFEKPPSDECEERQKLREEVYEAMAEGEREEKLQKTCVETSEREDREMETNIEANKETDMEASRETNIEANKETDIEANKETNIEANKETNIEANKETNIEANKETNIETNKETNIEANKETNMEASRETNIEANKETDTETNKETNIEANKETDIKANKETDIKTSRETNIEDNKKTNKEANKETDMEANKETDMEANKETDIEANKETDTGAGSCGSVRELCSVSACESQEKSEDSQEDKNNACAVEHSDDMVKDDSKNQEMNISKEDSVDCQADITEKYSGCASENQEGGVILEDTENKEEKNAKLAEISQSTSDQEHVITRENQEQESISSSDKSGQEGESEMDKQLDDGGPRDNQQEHSSMEVSSDKKEGKDCESATDAMDVTENSDSNENKDTGTNIAPRSDAPEQEKGDLSENKVKESVIKSHGEDDLTQDEKDETNKQKDGAVTEDVLTSSHDGGESSPQTQAAGAGAVQPDCVAEPDVPAGQAQNSDDVEMTENDDAADEGREDVDENEVVDEDDEINADDKDTEEEGEDKEEDVPNFQLAWEYLDLAKVIYLRSETSEDQLKAAECYIKLGELSMEIDQHATAAEDLQSALKIQQKLLSVEDRVIAETHYQLGLAYALGKEYELSVQYYTQALGVIESKIDLLKKLVREKGDDGENKENFEVNEQKKYIDEIAELQALIPEIKIKIEDTREESKDFEQMKQKCIEVLGFSKEAGSGKKSERADQEDIHENVEQEASNIAHLVRKKRKPEREEQELEVLEAKKIRSEDDCSSNLDKTINGSSQTEINAAGEGCPAEQAKDNPVPAEQTAA